MDYTKREPCKSCPYRVDSPPGFWDSYEFRNLLAQDSDPLYGRQFGCHEGRKLSDEKKGPCVGWLLDQKRRGVPSIQLRFRLIQNKEASKQFEEIDATGIELYSSIEEMCEANGVYAESEE